MTFFGFHCILFVSAKPISPRLKPKRNPPGATLLLQIIFLCVLMLCNAFFSAAEVALISLKPVTMEELKKRG